MIIIIGKKSRSKEITNQLNLKKIQFLFIEYYCRDKFYYKKKLYNERQLYNLIKILNDEKSLIFLVNVSSILNLKWDRFNTFITHGGHLPYYRGASVINWQIINNEKKIGLSIIKFDKKLDNGDVVKKGFINNNKPLTFLRKKIDYWYTKNIILIIREYERFNFIQTFKQIGKIKYWPKRKKKDSYLNIHLIQNFGVFKNLVFACEEGYWVNLYNKNDKLIHVKYCSQSINSCKKFLKYFKGKVAKLETINFNCYIIYT